MTHEFLMPNVRAKVATTVWRAGAAAQNWGEAPAPQAQCATPLGLSLSEGLGRTAQAQLRRCGTRGRATEDFLLLGSEVMVQLRAVRPIIAAAALPEYTTDCWPAATPRTKKNCWNCRLAATRNAPSVGALLSKLLCGHRSMLPRFIGSPAGVSEGHATDLAS
jgi:hypothetical protein